ncbi:hypothetical protein E2P71_02530 [Candidatus Bathyarchaeota archaeon]|nr:hypothetical protein E2P71_02530 [Candidatus Bathyarchaeota archaeon]
MGADFDEVWERIRQHRKETFTTVRGLKFRYGILGNWLVIYDTDFRVTKTSFMNADAQMPVADPEDFTGDVQGKYYIYAILTDPRINP